MFKVVSALVIASLVVGVEAVRADVDDCIDYMVSRGSSARDARLACSKAVDNNYPNSRRLSEAQQFCMAAQRGNGETLRYANGTTMTHNAGRAGASWYYPNGSKMSHSAGRVGASWYYSNGKTMTNNAGVQGATWYYPDGSVISANSGYLPMSERQSLYPCDYVE